MVVAVVVVVVLSTVVAVSIGVDMFLFFSFLLFWLLGGRLCVGIGIGRGSSSSLIVVAVIQFFGGGEGKGELRARWINNNNNYILIEIVGDFFFHTTRIIRVTLTAYLALFYLALPQSFLPLPHPRAGSVSLEVRKENKKIDPGHCAGLSTYTTCPAVICFKLRVTSHHQSM